ncbi:caspase family protein [Pyxidicoccus sp. 3LFB2]
MPSAALRLSALLIVVLAALVPARAMAARRVALIVSANSGWTQDRPLRHADDDARRLGAVLSELGDFAEGDIQLLDEPTTEQLRAGLEALAQRLKGSSEETLFVFYYSGHADAQHLHLRGAPLSFEELYGQLRQLPATLKLGILDACRSGAILGDKGGRPAEPFQLSVQDELAVRGTVILTSSGADELSQEARALSGSFFTHHLVSGLRGAADEDGDHRVSLEEVYRHASVRTLLDTASTPAGAQRPAFRTELSGRGPLFLTSLERPSATLVFPPEAGRCFVTDGAERRLVAEVVSREQRGTKLALHPGRYGLKCLEGTQYRVARLDLKDGQVQDTRTLTFGEAPLSEGVIKGWHGSQEPAEVFKRQGLAALEAGDLNQALSLFTRALRHDRRDREAFRGKARVYLALAAKTDNTQEKEQWVAAAIRTDPRLEATAELAGLPAVTLGPPTRHAARVHERNLRTLFPREYQGWGFGFSLSSGSGLLALSADRVLTSRFQASVQVSVVPLSAGGELRFVPFRGTSSLFVGVGGGYSAAAMGITRWGTYPSDDPEEKAFPGDNLLRVLFAEVGWQWSGPGNQTDLGMAVAVNQRDNGSRSVVVMPIISFKKFPGVAFWD